MLIINYQVIMIGIVFTQMYVDEFLKLISKET